MTDNTETPAGIIELQTPYTPLPRTALVGTSRQEQSQLVKLIGSRLKAARELCNLSQSAAARRLGYANPSKLSKVEAAADTNSVPLWLIVAAAGVYDVSCDFLLGIADDWESGLPRGTQTWMLEAWQRMRERDLLALDRVHREVHAAVTQLEAVTAAVTELSRAVSIYRAKNPDFDETPCSAVLHRLGALEAAATTAEFNLRKLKMGSYGPH